MIHLPAIQLLRVKLTAIALVAVAATAGHAVAKNHDCQTFKLRPAAVSLHDRAPGPGDRLPD